MTTTTRYTNRLGLPAAIVAATTDDTYSRGRSDITVSELIDPPRKVALTRAHEDEIVEDVADLLYRMEGKIMHDILERYEPDAITEERLYMEVLGWTVGGQMDNLSLHANGEDWHLIDWKRSTAWSVKGGMKPEWDQQLNLYAHLLRANGFPVTSAEIVLMMRDWSKLEARRSSDYPQFQMARMPARLWDPGLTQGFLEQRVAAHQAARETLPDCTPDERWARPDKWAVYKGQNQRAARGGIFDSLEEAEAFNGVPADVKRIEHRPGENVRCAAYCVARQFCSQADALEVPR